MTTEACLPLKDSLARGSKTRQAEKGRSMMLPLGAAGWLVLGVEKNLGPWHLGRLQLATFNSAVVTGGWWMVDGMHEHS